MRVDAKLYQTKSINFNITINTLAIMAAALVLQEELFITK